MKQEDKELLLKDLCARLPYYPKCEMIDELRVVNNEKDSSYISTLFPKHIELFSYHNNFTIRPYLRPMLSMTEEECDKVEEILGNDCIFDFMGNGDIVLHKGNFTQKTLSKLYDFYNSIHVDYHTDDEGRTMIEKGLALEAPEKLYLSDFTDTTESVFYVKQDNTKKTDIEYIRNDSFIEKACEYFAPHINDNSGGYDRVFVLEGFKKYMED